MRDVFSAHPPALHVRDGRTGLMPFMLAAAADHPSELRRRRRKRRRKGIGGVGGRREDGTVAVGLRAR